jgi:hypothetical protein
MNKVNVSKGQVNFSQRNNEVRPLESCNTTSYTMAMSYIPELWEMFKDSPVNKKYAKRFPQEEDRLQQFLLDIELDPTVHADLLKGVTHFMGRPVSTFSTALRRTEMIGELLKGKPVVLSGTFPGFPRAMDKPYGHIVVLVGAQFRNIDKPEYMIIDDPYGDTLQNWNGSGDDIAIPWDLFVQWFKPVGNPDIFWAHTFL